MKSKKGLILSSLVFLSILSFGSSGTPLKFRSGQAQVAQGYDGQTAQALLYEVQQLRLAIQRSNQNTPRTQIALERLRIQQDQVNSLTRELANIHDQIAESKSNQAQMMEFLKAIEVQMNKETDVTRRTEMESQFKSIRYELDQQVQREQRLQERETQLATQLQMEKAKLSELNDRLDAWEREIELQQSKDKPRQGGRRL